MLLLLSTVKDRRKDTLIPTIITHMVLDLKLGIIEVDISLRQHLSISPCSCMVAHLLVIWSLVRITVPRCRVLRNMHLKVPLNLPNTNLWKSNAKVLLNSITGHTIPIRNRINSPNNRCIRDIILLVDLLRNSNNNPLK
jgi:hypothetical protein